MNNRTWTRDETLAALNLYCRTSFGRLHARNPEIVEVAGKLGRTPNAVAMKCCNLASLDPALRARGIKGLSKLSKLDREVWEEFHRDPESVGFDSEAAAARIMGREMQAEESVAWEDVRGLDRESVTKVRVNQHLFRSIILSSYTSKCAVCRLPISSLLVASHIVPWSIDANVRMNPCNGICLCSLHDRAFDRGVLNIGADYQIRIHECVMHFQDTPSVETSLLAYSGKAIALPDRWHPDKSLLKRHGELMAENQSTVA